MRGSTWIVVFSCTAAAFGSDAFKPPALMVRPDADQPSRPLDLAKVHVDVADRRRDRGDADHDDLRQLARSAARRQSVLSAAARGDRFGVRARRRPPAGRCGGDRETTSAPDLRIRGAQGRRPRPARMVDRQQFPNPRLAHSRARIANGARLLCDAAGDQEKFRARSCTVCRSRSMANSPNSASVRSCRRGGVCGASRLDQSRETPRAAGAGRQARRTPKRTATYRCRSSRRRHPSPWAWVLEIAMRTSSLVFRRRSRGSKSNATPAAR